MKTAMRMRAPRELRGTNRHPSAFILPPWAVDRKIAGDAMPIGANLQGQLRHNEPMARHVSWRAGGGVDHAYMPADLADLQEFLRGLPAAEPVHLVGLGSNLLVRDGGLRGTVIFTHWALKQLRVETRGGEIYAEAGVASPKVARFAALHDLAGAEFLAGIPGTVGGALAMNAGCYGGETWNIVARVRTIDRRGQLQERTPAHYQIDYRTVVLKAEGERRKAEEIHPSSFILPKSGSLRQISICRAAVGTNRAARSRNCWNGASLRSRSTNPTRVQCFAIPRAIMQRG